MRKLVRILPLVIIVLVTMGADQCDPYPSALTVTYAFRITESAAMKDPNIGGKITDVNTQRKINALEGQFDSGWNCAYLAYENAVTTTPQGQPVVVQGSDFKPCLDQAWSAAFQLLATVRVFNPTFLTKSQDVKLPTGEKLTYEPITTPAIPASLALIPSKPVALK